MDPFSALSVATSVVQFVDFGSKLVSRAIEIHQSHENIPDDLADASKLSEKMSVVSEQLEGSMNTIPRRTLEPHEQELLDMCKQCQDISQQLISVINKLKRSANSNKWDSLRTAFRSIMSQPKILALQSKLDSFRQQLMLNILISLRYC
jgi:hypothetical protein